MDPSQHVVISPPIISIATGDVEIFRDVTSIEGMIEPPDVDEYDVWDSEGRHLQVVVRDATGYGPVKLQVLDPNPHEQELRELLLFNMLEERGGEWTKDASAVDLAEKLSSHSDLIGG